MSLTLSLRCGLPTVGVILMLEAAVGVEIEDAVAFGKFLERPFPPVAADGAVADERDAQIIDAVHEMNVPAEAQLHVVFSQQCQKRMNVVMHQRVIDWIILVAPGERAAEIDADAKKRNMRDDAN